MASKASPKHFHLHVETQWHHDFINSRHTVFYMIFLNLTALNTDFLQCPRGSKSSFSAQEEYTLSVKICPVIRKAGERLSALPVKWTIDNFTPGTEVLRSFSSRTHHLRETRTKRSSRQRFPEEIGEWLQWEGN